MYKALYRKWRPRTFSEVSGQRHIVDTLKSEVRQGKVSHAYLFCGVRGTGKTTCAKILSKAVNCLSPNDGEPCLTCDNCVGVENGSILDVYEIDAASNNGVDNIRDLRDEAIYAPATALRRVYIIDEVHMLSTGAFNAFLKLLEEPPAGVIFILATTEANKLPATILSRCQRFQFARISPDDIAARLAQVAQAEGIDADADALALIARLADGALRDALSILDRCAAEGARVTAALVAATAGVSGIEQVLGLSRAAKERDFPKATAALDALIREGIDLTYLCEQLLTHYRDLLMLNGAGAPESLLLSAADAQSARELADCAAGFDIETLLYNIRTAQDTLDRMARSANQRIDVELCLLRLCEPRLGATPEALIKRVAELERRQLTAPAPVQAVQPSVGSGIPDAQVVQPSVGRGIPDAPDDKPAAAPQATPAPKPKQPKRHPAAFWAEVQEEAHRLPRLSGFIAMARAELADGALVVTPDNAIAADMLSQPGTLGELTALVASVSGEQLPVRIEKPKDDTPPPGDPFDALMGRNTQ